MSAHGPDPDCTGTVAVLVLACHAPRVLEQLAWQLDDPRFRIHVHLDLKANHADFVAGRRWPTNLTFTEERHEVYWGGFSMIRATEAAARQALQDASASVFALVSDDTLPLRPADEICRELRAQPDRIDVAMSRRNPPFLHRYLGWYYMDSGATSVRPVDLGRRGVDEAMLDAMARLARARERGKFPFAEVWGGSQWWSLSRATLAALLSELSCNQWVRESFEFSAIPDEQAFHTLYANRAKLAARSFTSPMLADMTGSPAPAVFSAAEQIPALRNGKLFVRKVSDDAAGEVMARIAGTWSSAAGA
jgi:hypothetical protein